MNKSSEVDGFLGHLLNGRPRTALGPGVVVISLLSSERSDPAISETPGRERKPPGFTALRRVKNVAARREVVGGLLAFLT